MNRWDLMQRSGEEYAVVKKRTKEIKWIQDARMETVMKSQSSKWETDLEERMEVIRKHCKNFIFGSPKYKLEFAGTSTCSDDVYVFVASNDKKKSKEKQKEKKKHKKLSFKRKSKSYKK